MYRTTLASPPDTSAPLGGTRSLEDERVYGRNNSSGSLSAPRTCVSSSGSAPCRGGCAVKPPSRRSSSRVRVCVRPETRPVIKLKMRMVDANTPRAPFPPPSTSVTRHGERVGGIAHEGRITEETGRRLVRPPRPSPHCSIPLFESAPLRSSSLHLYPADVSLLPRSTLISAVFSYNWGRTSGRRMDDACPTS
jgi:hypothetical protein